MPNLQSELATRVFFVTQKEIWKIKKIVPQKPPLGFLVIRPFHCLTKQPLMTSLSFT